MPKPYSQDLRDRVIDAVERGEMSRRAAARRYAISEPVAIKWLERDGSREPVGMAATGSPTQAAKSAPSTRPQNAPHTSQFLALREGSRAPFGDITPDRSRQTTSSSCRRRIEDDRGGLFRDHVNCANDEKTGNPREDASVDNPQAFSSTNAEIARENGFGTGPDLASAGGVVAPGVVADELRDGAVAGDV
jgi:hypothetical protein